MKTFPDFYIQILQRPPFISLIENKQQKKEELTQTEEEWHANSIKSFKAFCFVFLFLEKCSFCVDPFENMAEAAAPPWWPVTLCTWRNFTFRVRTGTDGGVLLSPLGAPFCLAYRLLSFKRENDRLCTSSESPEGSFFCKPPSDAHRELGRRERETGQPGFRKRKKINSFFFFWLWTMNSFWIRRLPLHRKMRYTYLPKFDMHNIVLLYYTTWYEKNIVLRPTMGRLPVQILTQRFDSFNEWKCFDLYSKWCVCVFPLALTWWCHLSWWDPCQSILLALVSFLYILPVFVFF